MIITNDKKNTCNFLLRSLPNPNLRVMVYKLKHRLLHYFLILLCLALAHKPMTDFRGTITEKGI